MRRNFALAFLTGILIALSLPPFPTGFLAYGALIPFFLLLENKRIGEAFRWSYVTGLFVFTFTLYWLWNVTIPGLLGALLVLPLYFALYGVLHVFLVRRFASYALALVPFLWTAIEYIESFGETAFPWVYLGYSQTFYLPFIQFAEYTGVYGVSFWIALINISLYLMWKQTRGSRITKGQVVFLVLLFVIPFLHGWMVLEKAKPAARRLKVALLQGNIDPFEKWNPKLYEDNFAIYDRLTRRAATRNPDLIVWPETATPMWLRYEHKFRSRIHKLVDSTRIPLITGSIDYTYNEEGDYEHFNSAFLFEPFSARIQDYRKMQLVPFSERVPYSQYLPVHAFKQFLFDLKLGVGDYRRGKEYKVLRFGSPQSYDRPPAERSKEEWFRVSIPICYESVFPDLVRRFVRNGADLLVIITNDAWFGKTSAPYQHARIAIFRAIENRIGIARCANTGVSCFIDPLGHLTNSTPIFREAMVVGEVPLRTQTTFYTRFGNVFARLVTVIAFAAVLAGWLSMVLMKRKSNV